MPRTDRTRQAADERFDPIAHVVLEPLTGPAPSRATSKAGAQPPRPQNAWILYRAWALNGLLDKQPELRGKPQSQISKLLGQQWANETPEIRKHFEHQANLQKERHAQEYPNYVFKPQKKEDKEREREVKKKERARVRETEKLKKEIAKALRSGHVPQAVTGVPEGGTGEPTHATAESELHKFAVYTFDELGPSPPMSMCPSPDEIPKELPEGEEQEEALFDASETSAPENEVEMAVASSSKTTLDSNSESSTEQRSPLAVAPWVFSSSTPGKTQDAGSSSSSALGLAQGFDAYLKQCFPSFDPDEPSNVSMPPIQRTADVNVPSICSILRCLQVISCSVPASYTMICERTRQKPTACHLSLAGICLESATNLLAVALSIHSRRRALARQTKVCSCNLSWDPQASTSTSCELANKSTIYSSMSARRR